jgi:hypothetical protein
METNEMETHVLNLKKDLLNQLKRKIHCYHPYNIPEISCVVPAQLIEEATTQWQTYTPVRRKRHFGTYLKAQEQEFLSFLSCTSEDIQQTFKISDGETRNMKVDFTQNPPKLLVDSESCRIIIGFDFLPNPTPEGYIKQYRDGASSKKSSKNWFLEKS